MQNHEWTKPQKQHARRLFDAALQAELAEIMAEYKANATAVQTLEQMWAMSDYLNDKAREIDEKYVFTYSGLDLLFLRLINEGRLSLTQLGGIPEANFERIARFIAATAQ